MIIGIDASRVENKEKTGVEQYALNIIQQLKKQIPEDVDVFVYSRIPLTGFVADFPSNWKNKVLRWPSFRFSLWTQIRLSLELLFYPVDVLFIPAHVFPLIHPKKTIIMIHDIAAIRFPESYSLFEAWYSVWSAKKACKKLYKIIVPSEFTKTELVELCNANQDKISVIQHGFSHIITNNINEIETLVDNKLSNSILKKYNINSPYILCVGRIEEKKNTRRVVQAFDLLKKHFNIQLVLVGNPGYGFADVIKQINSSSYKKDIIQTGWLPEYEVRNLMRCAKVFVYAGVYEGFGLPILESFFAGTPLVCARGHAAEEVGADAALYVDAENVNEIEHAIQKFLSDVDLCQEYIEKGRIQLEDFSWEKAGKETVSILLEVPKT